MNERWVDGFNVIHRLPELAARLDADNEGCREDFLRRLAPLAFRGGERWTVIFDAPQSGRSRAAGPIDVVFTPDADAWILNALRREARPGRIAVVTNDRDIGDSARELGARVMPADALVAVLRRRENEDKRPLDAGEEKPDYPDPAEVDFWLDQFGGGGTGEPKGGL